MIPAPFSRNVSDFHMIFKPPLNAFHFIEELVDAIVS